MTGRDTEVTHQPFSDAAQVLFEQIRSLFRHVPISNTTLLQLAPNVARTLRPTEPQEALATFWQLFDEIDETKELEALKVLLGFTWRQGTVQDRKVLLNEDVHPRTVARWADKGIWQIVGIIVEKFSVASATLVVFVEPDESGLLVRGFADSNIDMEDLRIVARTRSTETEDSLSVENGVMTRFSVPLASHGHQVEFFWPGPVQPIVQVTSNGSVTTAVRPNYLRIGWT